jgi:hypothetical protein
MIVFTNILRQHVIERTTPEHIAQDADRLIKYNGLEGAIERVQKIGTWSFPELEEYNRQLLAYLEEMGNGSN